MRGVGVLKTSTEIVPYDFRNACEHPSEIPLGALAMVPIERPLRPLLRLEGRGAVVSFLAEEWMRRFTVDVRRGKIYLGRRLLCEAQEPMGWPRGLYPVYWTDQSRLGGSRRIVVQVEERRR